MLSPNAGADGGLTEEVNGEKPGGWSSSNPAPEGSVTAFGVYSDTTLHKEVLELCLDPVTKSFKHLDPGKECLSLASTKIQEVSVKFLRQFNDFNVEIAKSNLQQIADFSEFT